MGWMVVDYKNINLMYILSFEDKSKNYRLGFGCMSVCGARRWVYLRVLLEEGREWDCVRGVATPPLS